MWVQIWFWRSSQKMRLTLLIFPLWKRRDASISQYTYSQIAAGGDCYEFHSLYIRKTETEANDEWVIDKLTITVLSATSEGKYYIICEQRAPLEGVYVIFSWFSNRQLNDSRQAGSSRRKALRRKWNFHFYAWAPSIGRISLSIDKVDSP